MGKCERTAYCQFFRGALSEMPSIAERLKQDFCTADNSRCARYKILQKLRQGFSPEDEVTMVKISREMQCLFPDDDDKAQRIIKWLKKN